MKFRFRGRRRAFEALWFVQRGPKGEFQLGSILARPAGNFELALPARAFPVTTDLVIPGSTADRLNDLEELVLELDRASWSVAGLTIHELAVVDERLRGRMTLDLRCDDVEEKALLVFEDEKLTVPTSDSVGRAREDTFDLALGLGRMRWTDDRATLESQVYNSNWRSAGTGKNDRGERVRWTAGLEIPTFLMIFKGTPSETLWFSAFVAFGRDERVRSVTLLPYDDLARWNADEMLRWLRQKLEGEPDRNRRSCSVAYEALGPQFRVVVKTDGRGASEQRPHRSSSP